MCLKMICILSVLKDLVEKQRQCDLAKCHTALFIQSLLYTKAFNIVQFVRVFFGAFSTLIVDIKETD